MVLQLKHDTNGHRELTTEPRSVENHHSFDQIFAPWSSPFCSFYSPLSPSEFSSIGIAFRKPLAPSAEHVAISRNNISVAQGNSFMATSTLIFYRQLSFSNVRRPPFSKVARTVEQLVIQKPFATEARTCCQAQRLQAVAADPSEASVMRAASLSLWTQGMLEDAVM